MNMSGEGKAKIVVLTVLMLLILPSISLPKPLYAQTTNCFWGNFELLRVPFMTGAENESICELISRLGGGEKAVGGIISGIVEFLTVLVLMAAAVSIVIGGYIYMTAGGSAERVQLAKTWIVAALLGITIALTAWVVLATISPTLV